MAHDVKWFEVIGKDAAASQAFYGSLFGWTFATPPGMNGYGIVQGTQAVPGGVGGDPQTRWSTFYVGVDDLDGALTTAADLGATVLMPPRGLPDGSRIAVIADPDGLPVGLVQEVATA